jgi:putative cardiolipin synthase
MPGLPTRPRRAACARATTLLLLALLGGCASLPPLEGRSASQAIEAPRETSLRAAADRLAGEHANLSGFHSLGSGLEAFAARKTLIDAASSSLDVQYYIWHDDMTGKLLIDALRRAADRGVRVRMLLDDNNTKGMDGTLAALAAHPNVELRLFNPFMQRSARLIGYLTDFSRLNRRMHNKSLTADGATTIVGGRNIGDEYFDANEGLGFFDLDVLAVGPVVHEVLASFDGYWNSASAYPATSIVRAATPDDASRLMGLGDAVMADPAAQRYVAALRETALVRSLLAGQLSLEWAASRVVADEPSKVLSETKRHELLVGRLEAAIGRPIESEMDVVSPYFVPQKRGVDMFSSMTARGVQVRVLTNALEATDVAAVHSGYAHRRKALLKANVELFELKRSAGDSPTGSAKRHGSSGSSLHAKVFGIDRRQLFVGSFNFDPRSVELNTELGIVIDSAPFAGQVAQAFETRVPAESYRVRLGQGGDLEWVEIREGVEVVHTHEPGAGFFKRLWVGFLSILPIEGLL